MVDRRSAAMNAMERFKAECPGAGAEFPLVSSATLEGEAWDLESLRGRVVVLETGAFT